MWALTCGHSGFSGCDFCYQRGSTTNGLGEPLGTVRWLGCHFQTDFQAFDEQMQLTQGRVLLTSADGTFDTEQANALHVKNVLHKARCVAADEAKQRAFEKFPMPARARGGGDLTEDPSSDDQKQLTKGNFQLFQPIAALLSHLIDRGTVQNAVLYTPNGMQCTTKTT